MKKRNLILLPLLALTSCNTKTNKVNIICPTGAPAFAFYNYATKSNFQTNSVPNNIIGMMNKLSEKTVVVIDTVSGLKAINNGAPYKIGATITFGNFYICSTGKDNNNVMDFDDDIVLFGQNQTPDKIFNYIYGLDNYSNIHYVNAVSDAAMVCANPDQGKYVADYVFLAEPLITVNKLNKFINIQDVYKNKSNLSKMVQASIFIKDSLDRKVAELFLKDLQNDINDALNDSTKIVDGISKLNDSTLEKAKYGVPSIVASNTVKNGNSIGLGFEYAKNIKTDIDTFISLFNMEETNEEIYF